MDDDDRHVVRDMLYVLFKRRWLIGLIAFGALAGGLAFALVGIRYTSTARVLVTAVGSAPGQAARNQAELLRDPGALQNILPQLDTLRRERSPGPIAHLRARLDAWLHGGRDAAGLGPRIDAALRVNAVGDTDVVVVRLTWFDPRFAADALNLILADMQGSVSRAVEARQAVKSAAVAVQEAEAQLAAVDAQIAAVPVGADAVSLEREKDRVHSRLTAARGNADALRVDRELARRKIDTVDAAFKAGGWVDAPDSQETPAGTPALQQTFVTLLDKHQTMLTHLPPDNPGVRAVDQQIGRVREENYQAVKQVYTSKLVALDERLRQIDADSAADDGLLRDLDDRLVRLEALNQTRAAAAGNLASAQRGLDLERAQIGAVGRELGGMRVLSEAAAPARPDWPAPWLVVSGALFAGLVIGVLAAALAEATRRTLDRPRDIVRFLDLEVLARVPDLR